MQSIAGHYDQKPYVMITTKRSASQSIIGHRATYCVYLFANELPVTVLVLFIFFVVSKCSHYKQHILLLPGLTLVLPAEQNATFALATF